MKHRPFLPRPPIGQQVRFAHRGLAGWCSDGSSQAADGKVALRFIRTLLLDSALLALLCGRCFAQSVPALINYQGQLTDTKGDPLPTADHTLTINIYDAPTGGVRYWGPQVFDGSSGLGRGPKIPVVQGYFNVMLGPVDADGDPIADAFTATNRYIEITVTGLGSITPRQQVLSAPFALVAEQARNATTIGGGALNTAENGLHIRSAAPSVRFESTWGAPANWQLLANPENGALQFYDALRQSSLMVVSTSGNVGIGTSEPERTLHVRGDGVRVTGEANPALSIGPPGSTDYAVFGVATLDGGGLSGARPNDTILAWRSTGNLLFGSDYAERLRITRDGSVGINTTAPSFLLHVHGSAGKPGGGSWSVASDARLKRGIVPLHGTLDRLLQLEGKTFEFREPDKIGELPGRQTGMVAQEVEKVFPDWVDEGPDGYKRLTYRGFEALTVEALRDLRAEKDGQIAQLRLDNQSLQQRLADLERAVHGLLGQVEGGTK